MPKVPTNKSDLLPVLSIKYMEMMVKITETELNKIPDENAASVPIPVCLKIEVA